MNNPLRIATRKSRLALCQAMLLKQQLLNHYPDLDIIMVPLNTSGDQLLTHPLAAIGGKGLFTKEIEEALLNHQADIAVHSMKDMPVQLTDTLEIAAYLPREDPRDALISDYQQLSDLPVGSKVGTASLRRQSLVKYYRKDLYIETLRGNVDTRLSKLKQGQYDAIILAAAGLHRLNLADYIQSYFSLDESLPAVGQGIIGIQCRQDDKAVKALLQPLDHTSTRLCITAERALNAALGGSCHAPIGGYANLLSGNTQLRLRGRVYKPNGDAYLDADITGSITHISILAEQVAEQLFSQGAAAILKSERS